MSFWTVCFVVQLQDVEEKVRATSNGRWWRRRQSVFSIAHLFPFWAMHLLDEFHLQNWKRATAQSVRFLTTPGWRKNTGHHRNDFPSPGAREDGKERALGTRSRGLWNALTKDFRSKRELCSLVTVNMVIWRSSTPFIRFHITSQFHPSRFLYSSLCNLFTVVIFVFHFPAT